MATIFCGGDVRQPTSKRTESDAVQWWKNELLRVRDGNTWFDRQQSSHESCWRRTGRRDRWILPQRTICPHTECRNSGLICPDENSFLSTVIQNAGIVNSTAPDSCISAVIQSTDMVGCTEIASCVEAHSVDCAGPASCFRAGVPATEMQHDQLRR